MEVKDERITWTSCRFLDSTEAAVAAAPFLPAGDQPWSDVTIVQYVTMTMWGT